MNLYPWLIVIHIVGLITFFVAHGASAAVAFRLRRERDLERVRALLETSSSSIGIVFTASYLVAAASGIAAGFVGGWWGRGWWIWISLALFILIALVMTPMAAIPMGRIRTAAGIARGKSEVMPEANPEELQRLLEAWNPLPIALIAFATIAIITWLMVVKPI